MEEKTPDFRDPDHLREHVETVLGFYYPECIDGKHGGYVHQFSDVGVERDDSDLKHLVGTCRFVFNFSVGKLLDGPDWCQDAARRGVDFLLNRHHDREYGGYLWVLDGHDVADGTKYCYGHAFLLLALALAARAGVDEAGEHIGEVYDLIIDRFWNPAHGLCRAEYNRDWSTLSPYRGQNANMHMCEAMIAGYEATGEDRYLDHAIDIAKGITKRKADIADGFVWEHYTEDWDIDWSYNREDPNDLIRPWGYLSGHQVEWTKLLLILDRFSESAWRLERARSLFDRSLRTSWDEENGGMYYTFSRDGEIVNDDKFYWVMAEAFSAAALLANRTGDACYWDRYEEL